ncbi:alpha/beta fold hydrolase [Janibacter sp. RAF52]|uniref:alpha/beta fold hydrolase n=1 Tax=unclassified Janibacter TaxID=2649294 RepID=UPI003F8E52A0
MSANGARFHVTSTGTGPVVLFVHGYPQFWWSWRDQLPAVAAAGYRAVAVDLRGFGASDKPPSGYDAPTACDDLAAVIRSLGAERVALVGQGLGATFVWSMPTHHPGVTAAIAPMGMPHPAVFHHSMWRHPVQWRANRYLRAMQTPFASERQSVSVARRLHDWSGHDRSWITDEVERRYTEAMAFPFAGVAAAEYHRWFYRCRLTPTGLRYLQRVKAPVEVPVLHLHGAEDPTSLTTMAAECERHVTGPLEVRTVPGAGAFVPEEAPRTTNEALIAWLAAVHPAR